MKRSGLSGSELSHAKYYIDRQKQADSTNPALFYYRLLAVCTYLLTF